jgi:hypothetical protein
MTVSVNSNHLEQGKRGGGKDYGRMEAVVLMLFETMHLTFSLCMVSALVPMFMKFAMTALREKVVQ